MGKLTAAQVKHAGPGRHGDGGGLYLYVRGGSRLWLHRYQINGTKRFMSLGSADTMSLREAREKAAEHRRQLAQKIDPLAQRKALAVGARIAALTGTSFEQLARRYVDEVRSKRWRGDKSRREWLSTLERHAFPKIGPVPVAGITKAMVHEVLHPVFVASPHVGQRLRERIEAVLDYATSAGLREGANPAAWKGHLEHAFASFRTETKHHAAMPFVEVPGFMGELRALPGVASRALEFLVLTAARTGETRFARWPEFDLQGRVWTIPAERMKGGKEHRVPLSDRAVEILGGLPRDSEAVFPGKARGGFQNQDAMADVLGKLRPGATVHGMRSTFRTWAAERTTFAREVAEAALAHVVGNEVERSYMRSDMIEQRRKL
ncbi:MAG: integrase, partial [Microvirga sp.]|nr:integrase [Microvirga sp.]